jgi:hypothetical protein
MDDILSSFLSDISKNAPKQKSSPIINIPKKISKKLKDYQIKQVMRLINILLTYMICLDASDTGIGKTYIAIAICAILGKRPIIISPKIVMFYWLEICRIFGVEPYCIVNYETARDCNIYTNFKFNKRKPSPYVKFIDKEEISKDTETTYIWRNIPEDAALIIDEAHRCRKPSSYNGKFLISTKQLIKKNIPVILLSATISENIKDMKIPFFLFDIIPSTKKYTQYVKGLRKKTREATDQEVIKIIHNSTKEYTGRIRIKDLGDQFPSNQWCAQLFVTDDYDKISKAHNKIARCIAELNGKGGNHLGKIQKLKQKIELMKVPIFVEQAELYLEEGKSVIIFVNYLKTLLLLGEMLEIKCFIYGKQTIEERKKSIDLFQSNKRRIIACQARAGGSGIGLHDLHGGHPRAVLINYPDTAAELLQELGRGPRVGSKTPVIQRIICVANVPYEKNIADNINKKLSNISMINDGDLNGYDHV